MTSRLLLLALALVLAFGSPATGQVVTDLSVDGGTIGTEFTVTGEGFGPAKPKLWLVPEDSSKGRRLKVLDWSTTSVTVRIRRAQAGPCDLRVKTGAPGLDPILVGEAFTIREPVLESLAPAWVEQKDLLVLTGTDFGTRKPKVKIDGRKAKVLDWGMETATVRVPKKLKPPVVVDVLLKNRVGTSTLVSALTVLGGPVGGGTPTAPLDEGSIEVLDFESLAPGTIVGEVSSANDVGPVVVLGTSSAFPGQNAAVVFDSSNPTGEDPDLGTPNEDFDNGPGVGSGGSAGSPFANDTAQGHLLIIGEDLDTGDDGLVDDPDDATLDGSTIDFDFAAIAPVTVGAITIVDIETARPAATVELFDGEGASLGVVPLPQVGDNGVAVVSLGPTGGVHRMVVTLNGSGAIDDIEFAVEQPATGSIGDTVWCDLDDDGELDDGEPGIEGVAVDLRCAGDDGVLGTDDDLTASTVSGPDGDYLFAGLPAGICQVAIDLGSLPEDKVPGACPTDLTVKLAADEAFLDADFCLVTPGQIGDSVFCDLDGDGLAGDDEPGIGGVLVELTCAGDDDVVGTIDDVVQTTLTDAEGHYLFDGVAPGTCEVTVADDTVPGDKVLGDCPEAFLVELEPGAAFLAADFCFVTPGEIGDTVFCDVDGDGLQGDDEPGIEGVLVVLTCAGADGLLGTDDDPMSSQYTDADGGYLFTSVVPDVCSVAADPDTAPGDKVPGNCPAEYVVDLGPDDSFLGADFCFVTPGEIGDTVFCDIDGDGVLDDGEPGIADVTVELSCTGVDGVFGTDDDIALTTITEAGGHYLFTDVPPGTCVVAIDPLLPPSGKQIGACPPEVTHDLAPAESFLEADFCFEPIPGVVGDTVFCDEDFDGVQGDDEPGIAGVVVELWCAGIDGMLGTDDDFMANQVTDADGFYLFDDVSPGLCRAEVDASTAPEDKVPGVCPPRLTFDLLPGGEFLDADFCFSIPMPGMVGDTVWCDLDDDGVQDEGEPGIAGVLVDLRCAGDDGVLGTDDDLVATQLTDEDGMYLFDDVPPGPCAVGVDPSTAGDKVPGLCPLVVAFDLTPGQAVLDADFCFVEPPARIGDLVWCDLDDDGERDDDEPGIGGVVVKLTCSGEDGIIGTDDDSVEYETTDADGMYLFDDVPVQLCLVQVDATTAPDGKVLGSCPAKYALDVSSGQEFLDADFCFVSPAVIGDRVFCIDDDDGDGIEGVVVKLTCAGLDEIIGTDDDSIQFETTDDDGMYLFVGVPTGLCLVQVVSSSVPDDKVPGDCAQKYALVVSQGQVFLDADFCFVEVEEGEEGCSPGYWKQSQHFDEWDEPYDPDTLFDDVFQDAFPGMTLLEVLQQGGGQIKALGRQTVAALLNAAHDDLDYEFTMEEVIDLFDDVFPGGDYEDLKDDFEDANQVGCPLS